MKAAADGRTSGQKRPAGGAGAEGEPGEEGRDREGCARSDLFRDSYARKGPVGWMQRHGVGAEVCVTQHDGMYTVGLQTEKQICCNNNTLSTLLAIGETRSF